MGSNAPKVQFCSKRTRVGTIKSKQTLYGQLFIKNDVIERENLGWKTYPFWTLRYPLILSICVISIGSILGSNQSLFLINMYYN